MAEAGIATRAKSGVIGQEQVMWKIQELRRVLYAQELDMTAVYLYGSYAAGTADADSDIDVAVISPDLTGDRLQDWVRLTTLATRLDARFEVIGFRPEQFRDEHPLAWEVKTRGILVQ